MHLYCKIFLHVHFWNKLFDFDFRRFMSWFKEIFIKKNVSLMKKIEYIGKAELTSLLQGTWKTMCSQALSIVKIFMFLTILPLKY